MSAQRNIPSLDTMRVEATKIAHYEPRILMACATSNHAFFFYFSLFIGVRLYDSHMLSKHFWRLFWIPSMLSQLVYIFDKQ